VTYTHTHIYMHIYKIECYFNIHNLAICNNISGSRRQYVKWSKQDTEIQVPHPNIHM
jgi:hypothetical protein